MRGTVVSQEGAMVLVQLPTGLLRVNQSKVRRDHDEWHDVQIPHLEGPSSDNKSGSSNDEVDSANTSFVSEHEVCYHLCFENDPVDCVEVLHTCSGIGAYLSHQGKTIAPAVGVQFTSKKSLQQSIALAWKDLVKSDSSLVILPSLLRMILCVRNSGVSVLMLLDGKPKWESTVW